MLDKLKRFFRDMFAPDYMDELKELYDRLDYIEEMQLQLAQEEQRVRSEIAEFKWRQQKTS